MSINRERAEAIAAVNFWQRQIQYLRDLLADAERCMDAASSRLNSLENLSKVEQP